MSAKLDSIRTHLALLARCDANRQVFGAHSHDYELGPVLDEAAVAGFEQTHGVTLPADYREFITTLGDGGAGPFYGLAPLRADPPEYAAIAEGTTASVGRPFALTEAWRQSTDVSEPPVPAGATAYDGTIELSSHGCGYFDLLIVHGPRRGEVWADFTQAFGGMVPWYPSFTAAYEAWLDRAWLDWASASADALLDDDDEVIAEALPILAPLLERAHAELDAVPSDPARIEYPLDPGKLLAALAYLRARQRRTNEALALLDQLAARSGDDGEAQRLLGRAHVFAYADQLEAALEAVDAGLGCPGLWFATELALVRHQRTILRRLERDDEVLGVCRRLAEMERDDLFAQYDLAWVLIEREDYDEAAAVVRAAAERGVACDETDPMPDRIAQVAASLLDALLSAELLDGAAALRERLGLD